MSYVTFRASLTLHTAFGTPLSGDTLFGQLCWTAREYLGEAGLEALLEGYTTDRPWLVVSDGFPSGYLPKPAIPQFLLAKVAVDQRKAEKAKKWLPYNEIGKPLQDMQIVDDKVAFGENGKPVEATQFHNTLNRLTGSTGTGEFAPYTQAQLFFAQGQCMELYLVLDESRMALGKLKTLLQTIGSCGFGRDASIGLGKFTVDALSVISFAQHPQANAYLTLAPSVPQGQNFNPDKSYWRVLTRFGRHGNLHGISSQPFKNPLLLASTAAVFVPQGIYMARQFIGQGIGGNGQLSEIEPATVHQGYAPVVGIRMEE